MASASVHRKLSTNKPTKALSEQARIDLALKQAAAHARKQLAAQGLKLPTQSWKTGKISNPVVFFIEVKSNNRLLHLFTQTFEFRIL